MGIVLVTGGSRGLGRDMALRLAESGHNVILTYRSRAGEAEAVVQAIRERGRKAAALALDVSDSTTFPDFFEQLRAVLASQFGTQSIDYLVNNAGSGLHAPFAETTPEQFD